MRRLIYILILVVVGLHFSACHCVRVSLEEEERLQKRAQPASSFIGKDLNEYIDLQPVADDLSEGHYRNMEYNLDKDFYAYSIEIDNEALNKAKEEVVKEYKLAKDNSHTKGNHIEVYRNKEKRLVINTETGGFFFKDEKLAYKGYDKGIKLSDFFLNSNVLSLEEFDRKPILDVAQEVFNKYIPKELLKNTYFYRFAGHIVAQSDADGTPKHTLDELAVAVNPTVNAMAVLGSGGKYSVHIQPDGTVTSLRFQFAKFNKIENAKGKLIDPKILERKLEDTLMAEKLNKDNYAYYRSEFGYAFQSANGPCKSMVPIVSYTLYPKKEFMGPPRVFQFPASNDPELNRLYQADVESEVKRKEEKLTDFDVVGEKENR